MAGLLRLFYPYGLLVILLAGASLFFGADTPMTSFLFSAALLLLAGTKLVTGKSSRLPQVVAMGLILLGCAFVFDAITGRTVFAMNHYAIIAAALCVYMLAESEGRLAKDAHRLWQVILIVLLMIAVWAFADFTLNPDMIHGQPRPYHEDRLSAAFLSANTAATFFGITILAATASILRALRKVVSLNPLVLMESLFRHGMLGVVTFLFAAVCLLLTASRAGLTFTLVCLGILFFWEVLSRRTSASDGKTDSSLFRLIILAVAGISLLGVFFWNLSGDVAGARYADLDEDANMRLVMFSAYWEAFLARPFTGYGFGSFSTVNDMIMTSENAHILATQGAAHNIALQWLLQTGIVGTLCAVGIVVWMIWTVRTGFAHKRYGTYLRTILIISLFILLHGQVDYALEIPGVMWWWMLFLGLGAGLAARGSRKRQ
ncbi:O-antigen ligase [Parvularcula sp. IMCC14364]|uniref:O-antigen ligase family protein n=1 Tax=Parvularcula sp. IMCC14364 TaxID=3067902 RepID=UPI0027424C37|nr:O-antigen ligase family protein [Parvularcula sp. IMCC14364]